MDYLSRLISALLITLFFPCSLAFSAACTSYRVQPSTATVGDSTWVWESPGFAVSAKGAAVGSRWTQTYSDGSWYKGTIIDYDVASNMCTVVLQSFGRSPGSNGPVTMACSSLYRFNMVQGQYNANQIGIYYESGYAVNNSTLEDNPALVADYYDRNGLKVCNEGQRYTLFAVLAPELPEIYFDTDACFTVGGVEKCKVVIGYKGEPKCEACATGDLTPNGLPPVGDMDNDGVPDDLDSSPAGPLNPVDSDGDRVPDANDPCPYDRFGCSEGTGGGGDTGGGDTGGGDTGGGDTGGGDTGGGDTGGGDTGGGGTGTGGGTPSPFCQENPNSPVCKNGSWGGSCAGGFTCDGDAIQCAISKASWQMACLFEPSPGDDKAAIGEAAMAASGAGVSVSESSVGDFDTTNPYANTCISDVTVTVMSASFVIPLSLACPYLAFIGWVLVAGATLGGVRIALT